MPLQKDTVYVYGAYWCPHCVRAKKMLEGPHGRQTEYIEIGDGDLAHADKFPEHRDKLQTISTVPAVFVGTEYLGGSDALQLHLHPPAAASLRGGGAQTRESAPTRTPESSARRKTLLAKRTTPAPKRKTLLAKRKTPVPKRTMAMPQRKTPVPKPKRKTAPKPKPGLRARVNAPK
jgi:glutaredoxin